MKLALVFVLGLVLQLALTAAHFPWLFAACQPLLLVTVYAARTFAPVGVAWTGLAAGLATDVLAERIIGPGGIAGALAGIVVAALVRRFEMHGPLFWIVGSLVAAASSELAWLVVVVTLGMRPDHTWLGALATVVMTAAAGFLVALGELAARTWGSAARRRRRALQRL
jgi:rod shape-determining protein MreD